MTPATLTLKGWPPTTCGAIARAGAWHAMLTSKDFWAQGEWCNQLAYHNWFRSHPESVTLDYHCRVFYVLASWKPWTDAELEIADGRLHNRAAGSYPCVLHGPGKQLREVAAWWQRLTNPNKASQPLPPPAPETHDGRVARLREARQRGMAGRRR